MLPEVRRCGREGRDARGCLRVLAVWRLCGGVGSARTAEVAATRGGGEQIDQHRLAANVDPLALQQPQHDVGFPDRTPPFRGLCGRRRAKPVLRARSVAESRFIGRVRLVQYSGSVSLVRLCASDHPRDLLVCINRNDVGMRMFQRKNPENLIGKGRSDVGNVFKVQHDFFEPLQSRNDALRLRSRDELFFPGFREIDGDVSLAEGEVILISDVIVKHLFNRVRRMGRNRHHNVRPWTVVIPIL